MASRNSALALASALLTPKNIDIAEQIIAEHFSKAMKEADGARVREISDLFKLVEAVKNEA